MDRIAANITRNGCNWCDAPAPYAITENGWTDYACRRHAVEHFPNLWCVETTSGVRLLVLEIGYAPVSVWVGRVMEDARYRHYATRCPGGH